MGHAGSGEVGLDLLEAASQHLACAIGLDLAVHGLHCLATQSVGPLAYLGIQLALHPLARRQSLRTTASRGLAILPLALLAVLLHGDVDGIGLGQGGAEVGVPVVARIQGCGLDGAGLPLGA